ncbi:MAG: 3'-5' exonuclease [Ramlibacter sp.]|nr:3'-5' exonuclease [Ramlibacter sp.]
MSLRDWLRGRPAFVADEARWVMLDVETSGLDAARDQLLAIAAIAMEVDWANRTLRVVPGDSFEVVLRQQQASTRDNILLHGIGAQRQRDGVEPGAAMQAFAAFIGHSPLLAFHAAFDQALIGRWARAHLGAVLPNPWVDIEQLCAVTWQDVRARSLDEWMAHFGITCAVRHQAAADTLAECELLQRIWPRVVPQASSWRDVEKLAAQQRWIARA